MRAGWWGAIFALMVCVRLSATVFILSDFDDTFVETRASKHGTFRTDFYLIRNNNRATTMQSVPTGPERLLVSPQDLHRIQEFLARGERRPGAIHRTFRLEYGETISPGDYRIVDPDTYARFREAPVGQNFILEDFRRAYEHGGQWQGPFFPYLQEICRTPRGAKAVRLISARGHSAKELGQLFRELRTRELFAHEPDAKLSYMVSRPEFDELSVSANIADRKAAIFKELAYRLSRIDPGSEEDERLNPEGTGRGRYHYVVYADDNQEMLAKVAAVMTEFSRRRIGRTKFAIFNTGTATEVRESGRPAFAVVRSDGTFRVATAAERVGEFSEGIGECAAALSDSLAAPTDETGGEE